MCAQNSYLGEFLSPLGEELRLVRFMGHEGINELFEFEVEFVSETRDVDFDQLIGAHGGVRIFAEGGAPRFFDGVITDGMWGGTDEFGARYVVKLRPWFWTATRRFNHDIYHEMTAPQILEKLLTPYTSGGTAHLENKLTGTYAPLEYTVQHGESDYTFACRIMERFGINFWFEHSDQGHTMVLVDDVQTFPSIGKRDFVPMETARVDSGEYFWRWSPMRTMTANRFRTQDYNFKSPSKKMMADQTGDAAHPGANLEIYEYPGVYLDEGAGKSLSKMRIEQERARDKHHKATGNTLTLGSGMRVDLDGQHDSAVIGSEYLCIGADHLYTAESYRSSREAGDQTSFVGTYEFAPADLPFLPERKTQNTRMAGPQTAKVVGSGEIDCDEHGRILVQFHWDTEGKRSMRCRCAQLWAQNGWGAMFIPRVGMEVVVIFIDGDPNRPLVTGTVYHGENTPPYPLPGDKNWNGIKSNSTEGGGGYNELVFNDTKGDELFRQHAQYDMETKVLHDERRDVLNDRTTNIGRDETRQVGRDESHTINDNRTYSVGKNETFEIGVNSDWKIGSNETREVKKNRDTKIGTNDTLNVGNTLEVTANTKISFKVGTSTIEMTPTGVTIKAINIKVEGQMLNTKGTMATHEAVGVMTIKGGMVMIN
ncbi:type VI secretion system tip protein TssI/VgrG [Roseicyclus sp. F158]|uniref:Type VI secretion system tip protein TssI/VgrG n=1 Tax=Tropicimonas omnivorans TaxID=3075590 RepID=A0ABU3DE09_9RHOB|nr:type VI secretion system tip protein TssI/VgrG [Roseicyclus sp. F158]MDT0681946.1 type VI secretion system tip protein TssI/VgrG [Roseicyclus sp. F158]